MTTDNTKPKTINEVKDNDADNWADEKWVADLIKVKPNPLRKQRSKGINFIPYYKLGGRVRYNKLEVHAALEERKVSND